MPYNPRLDKLREGLTHLPQIEQSPNTNDNQLATIRDSVDRLIGLAESLQQLPQSVGGFAASLECFAPVCAAFLQRLLTSSHLPSARPSVL